VLISNRCTTPQRGPAMAVKSHEYIRDYCDFCSANCVVTSQLSTRITANESAQSFH